MKASEANLLLFLRKSSQFVVPIYQRTYSWTEKQCRQLWNDILRAGLSDAIPVHFIGSIVYVEQGLSQATNQSPLLVIDGQQRLTTVALLLEALAREIGDGESIGGLSAKILREEYLTNRHENGDRYFKLLLSQTDNDSLKAFIKNTEQPTEPSVRVTQNFALFTELLKGQKGDLVPVCRGLAKLGIVDIALNRDQDNPQLIFESMNSTGKELSQADLIRNFILMGLEPKLQTRLYQDYWRKMELDFGQEAYGKQFDSFMRHYLTVRTGAIPREHEVYEAFKGYSLTTPVRDAGIEALVKEILAFARYFCAMALETEKNAILRLAFHDLRELKVNVAYPFLLELYHDYACGAFSVGDFTAAVRMVEAYVFRRAICAIPTSSMNKTFATFSKVLKKECYLKSIQAHFLLLPSYRHFPNDDEFRHALETRDLFNSRSCSNCLCRLENYIRKEPMPENEYTIEHILPRNPNLPMAWQEALGADWQRIQRRWLHTLGNLTLTGYNSALSDRPFVEKRDMTGGFKQSPLKLNAMLGQLDEWNEAAIQKRARQLADQALVVWRAPILDAPTLAAFQPKKVPTTRGYTLNDHPKLLTPEMGELFGAFRKEVLSLDACVYEDFLKHYVAYKAKTNFVDVVPKSKWLRLSLNMPFGEINDPKRMCKDITNLKKWGNGNVELILKSPDELPYIMSLVRQSYEHRMGDTG